MSTDFQNPRASARGAVNTSTTSQGAPRKRAPGAGRKPLEGGIVSVNLTLTPAHRDQLKALGGSAWVRKMLDAVRAVEKPQC